jgi:prevent-host-death family protein
MKARVVSATEFKAKCLAFLDEVDEQAGTITITKRGRPVAVLGPTQKEAWKSPQGSWSRKVRIEGDIVNADTSAQWNVVAGK